MHRGKWSFAVFGIVAVLSTTLFSFSSPTSAQGSRTVIYLTSGSTWQVPSDWNSSSNKIEVIGGGAGGVASSNGASGGGGGGAYSSATNVSLPAGQAVTISVGAGGSGNQPGGDTYLCNSTAECASIGDDAVVIGAGGGATGSGTSGGAGGQASVGIGSTKYSGGNGGDGAGGSASDGGGGGGAAGPSGNGANGGNGAPTHTASGGGGGGGASGGSSGTDGTQATGGNGGSNRFGSGGGLGARQPMNAGQPGTNGGGGGGAIGGAVVMDSGNGGTGTDWDGSHGSGGGGGGGSAGEDFNGATGYAGGDGALYGGGGGGGKDCIANPCRADWAPDSSNSGAPGVIRIEYDPAPGATCSVNVTPSAIQSNESATLSWSSTNATSFHISTVGAVTPNQSGSASVAPASTTNYVGTAQGPQGSVTCQASLTVTQPLQCPNDPNNPNNPGGGGDQCVRACVGNGYIDSCTDTMTACGSGQTCSNGQCISTTSFCAATQCNAAFYCASSTQSCFGDSDTPGCQSMCAPCANGCGASGQCLQ